MLTKRELELLVEAVDDKLEVLDKKQLPEDLDQYQEYLEIRDLLNDMKKDA